MKEWRAEEIKDFRKKLNLPQWRFGELIGVTREHVLRLEKGGKQANKTIKLLLDCLEREQNGKGKGARSYGKAKGTL